MRLESRRHERERLEKAKEYDRAELKQVINSDFEELARIDELKKQEREKRTKMMYDQ